MKQELDREMDSLLRGALQTGARPSDVAGAHPSADELCAYAERALPPAARARYTAHVADCAECRRVVAGIAVAAGVVPAREEQIVAAVSSVVPSVQAAAESKTSAGLGARLASIFSPRVLRFAMPLLAVALLGVVALVVMQRGENRDGATQTAQRSDAEASNRTAITQTATNTSTAGAPTVADETQSNAVANVPALVNQQAGANQRQPGAPVGGVGQAELAASDAPAPPPVAKGVPADALSAVTAPETRDQPKGTATQSAAAVQPVPPAPSKSAERTEAADLSAREVAALPKKAAAEEEKREEQETVKEEDEGAGRLYDRRSGPSRNLSRNAISRNKSRADDDTAGEYRVQSNNAATGGARASEAKRTVAGREFQRRGDEWVDTSFRDSMAVSRYRRGTESFRALVADIPEIGRIAAELSGTVTVVVRGRAYRIQ